MDIETNAVLGVRIKFNAYSDVYGYYNDNKKGIQNSVGLQSHLGRRF